MGLIKGLTLTSSGTEKPEAKHGTTETTVKTEKGHENQFERPSSASPVHSLTSLAKLSG